MITVTFPEGAYSSQFQQIKSRYDNNLSIKPVFVLIHCNRDGVAWRGLYPILFEARPEIVASAVTILLRNFGHREGRCRWDVPSGVSKRKLKSDKRRNGNIQILILPPQQNQIYKTFEGLLVQWEHLWLQMKSLSAWIATLGGGYFLCRHLNTAIRLAQQQRFLAELMGDESTADKCTLNEAFNYLHAGRFIIAKKMIKAVEKSATKREDWITIRMVQSAILFLKRVKSAAKFARGQKDDTLDDYLRIRIVQDRSIRQE